MKKLRDRSLLKMINLPEKEHYPTPSTQESHIPLSLRFLSTSSPNLVHSRGRVSPAWACGTGSGDILVP